MTIPPDRSPQSPVIQFYSSVSNIGNYLPVAGIREMLDAEPDTWCIHRSVDFDFVNANYSAVVIGGAGLLHRCFNQFWHDFANHCSLPVIIWGVGTCLPDGLSPHEAACDTEPVQAVAARAHLVNVRDDLTADIYDLQAADISACPTIAYLARWNPAPNPRSVTLAMHPDLASTAEHRELAYELSELYPKVKRTENVQSQFSGVDDIVSRFYLHSDTVVTTRLHGAIIAYALGVPYVALARDQKVREFNRLYGGGLIVEEVERLKAAMDDVQSCDIAPRIEDVLAFGRLAKSWLGSAT